MTATEEKQLAGSMYSQGASIRDVAKALRVSYGAARTIILASGVTLKNMGGVRKVHDSIDMESLAEAHSAYGANPLDMEEAVIPGELRPLNVVDVTSHLTGILCDVHAPFHALSKGADGALHGAYMTALRYLKDRNCQTVVLNGDFMDCYQLSRHEKLESHRDFAWELDVTRGLLAHLRSFFGDEVRIIYREGNHEERLPKILAAKIPELRDMISLPELLHLSKCNIEWLGNRDRLRIGSLWVDHGHEWFGSGGVNPARAYRMKAGDNIMIGHVHRTTYDNFKRPLDGTLYAGWTVGCLCDLNPHYAPRNAWNHGVAVVELFDNGEFMVDNRIIINERIR